MASNGHDTRPETPTGGSGWLSACPRACGVRAGPSSKHGPDHGVVGHIAGVDALREDRTAGRPVLVRRRRLHSQSTTCRNGDSGEPVGRDRECDQTGRTRSRCPGDDAVGQLRVLSDRSGNSRLVIDVRWLDVLGLGGLGGPGPTGSTPVPISTDSPQDINVILDPATGQYFQEMDDGRAAPHS
jgi:hypothetical protein